MGVLRRRTSRRVYYRRASRYVTHGATCAINSDVVGAGCGALPPYGRRLRAHALERPTYDYVSRTVYVTRSNEENGAGGRRTRRRRVSQNLPDNAIESGRKRRPYQSARSASRDPHSGAVAAAAKAGFTTDAPPAPRQGLARAAKRDFSDLVRVLMNNTDT
ncbi:hypothetical protein ACJJTC_015416 [Scirpophaga incertulas]